jgi:predicted nucleic-acid-binding protein
LIGLDTNVLLRLFIDDDPAQTARARRLAAEALAARETLFIGAVVLAELAWVLDRTYRHARADVARLIGALLEDDLFVVEDAASVAEALADYRTSGADFADCLIGRRNLKAGCAATVTFDRAAGRQPGFRALV